MIEGVESNPFVPSPGELPTRTQHSPKTPILISLLNVSLLGVTYFGVVSFESSLDPAWMGSGEDQSAFWALAGILRQQEKKIHSASSTKLAWFVQL